MRTFMGYERTTCDCEVCARNCRFIPGYLLLEDLDNIFLASRQVSFAKFASEHLLASPGALVAKDGKLFRIPTIVPARNTQGWCRYFDGEHCKIHTVAPFGCAFHDHHQPQEVSNRIATLGILSVAMEWQNEDRSLYCGVWHYLNTNGLVAPAPEECRARMAQEG